MVPTLLLFGLILGRWWRTALVIALLGWPTLLLATDTINPGRNLAGAAVLAVLNAGIGVGVHQALSWCVRHLRRTPAAH